MKRRVKRDTMTSLRAMGVKTRGIDKIMSVDVNSNRYSVYLDLGENSRLYVGSVTLNVSANTFTGTPDSHYPGISIYGLDVDETNDMIAKALNIRKLINKL